MATIPVTPVTPVVKAPVSTSWLKTHERLIIVFLVLAFGTWGLRQYLGYQANVAKMHVTVMDQTLVAQKALDAQQAIHTAQTVSQYQNMVNTLAMQNATLAAAITSRNAGLGGQRATDTQLPLSTLGNRLQTLGNAPLGSVSNTGTTVTLTQPATLAVVETLEAVPVLSANLTNETTIAQNEAAEINKANGALAAQVNQINSLQITLTDQTKQCKLDIAAIKKVNRKQKLDWFLRGVVTGFVGGLFVHGA